MDRIRQIGFRGYNLEVTKRVGPRLVELVQGLELDCRYRIPLTIVYWDCGVKWLVTFRLVVVDLSFLVERGCRLGCGNVSVIVVESMVEVQHDNERSMMLTQS